MYLEINYKVHFIRSNKGKLEVVDNEYTHFLDISDKNNLHIELQHFSDQMRCYVQAPIITRVRRVKDKLTNW